MMDSKTALDFLNTVYRLKAKEIFAFLEEWEPSFLHHEFITKSGKDSYNIIKEQENVIKKELKKKKTVICSTF